MTNFLTHFHGPVIYLVVAGLLVAESGFGIGFFVPGELAVILGGALAREHRVDIVVMVLVANAAAIGSYLIGYGLGRARRGGLAVFIARFVVVIRAVMPALAGLSDLRLRTFIVFDIAGGLVWATLYTLLGYALGSAYKHALGTIGIWSYVLIGVLVVVLVFNHLRLSRRHRRQTPED